MCFARAEKSMSVKRSTPFSPHSDGKRVCHRDVTKAYSILALISDEVEIMEKIMYSQRNTHRRTHYYKSVENVCVLGLFVPL